MTEPDDTITDDELKRANNRADALFGQLIDTLYEEEEDTDAMAYALWVNLIHFLVDAGWTTEELTRDVTCHVANHDTEGSA